MKARNRICSIAAAIAILLISEVCFAFDDGDFQYWSNANASVKLNKNWTAVFEEELRLGDDGGRLYYHHSDLGFLYSGFAKWLDVGFNFREVFEEDSGGEWRQEHRPHLNAILKSKLLGCDFSSRSRFEYRDRENQKDLWRYRNKFTFKLPLELTSLKLKPYVADEIFIPLNNDNIDRNRFYSGVTFNLSKNIKADIFYLWQASKSGGDWKDVNALGTSLKFYF